MPEENSLGKVIGTKFTKEMRRTHTIYMPDMLHYHNELLQAAFTYGGYHLEVVPEFSNANQLALRYINNDYCSPTVSIVSQILAFLGSSECVPERTAILEPQAGGSCRAGNIYNLIIEVLEKNGYGQIPVISLNMTGSEKHEGFSINRKMISGCVAAVCYADLLMTLTQQIRPYEQKTGQTEQLRQSWIHRLKEDIAQGKNIASAKRKKIYQAIISDFQKIPRKNSRLSKVGIVGEIYIKFSPIGNCHLEEFLHKHQCAYCMGGFINYAAYVIYTEYSNAKLQKKNSFLIKGYGTVLRYICRIQRELTEELENKGMQHDACFGEIQSLANQIVNDSYNIGDGWLIAGEILDMIQQGYEKILIVHPFGCMVSHVGGRGIIKKIRSLYPHISIQSIEYDYDQSDALRESRILMAIGSD